MVPSPPGRYRDIVDGASSPVLQYVRSRSPGFAIRLAGALLSLNVMLVLSLESSVAAGHRIAAIEVAGNSRISDLTIREQFKTMLGQPFEAAQANAALKTLFASGQFADAQVTHEHRRLIVTVAENPVVSRLTITGREKISQADVEAAINIKRGDPYTRAKGEMARAAVDELYRDKGYQDTSVEIITHQQTDNRIELTLAINEGGIAKVERIGFIGNRAFTNRRLMDVITTRTAGMFDFLRGATPYSEQRLEIDRERLERHYRDNGYADVEVGTAKALRHPASGNWRIAFEIDEGAQYRYGPITFDNESHEIDTAGLRRFVPGQAGQIWNASAVETAVEAMTVALIEAGHMTTEVVARPDRDPAQQRMALAFVVRQRATQQIERIDIRGNHQTKDRVIRRELGMAEGDIYHPLLARRAHKRLMGLSVFESVDLQTRSGSREDAIRLVVEVKEQSTRELGYGAGYSTAEGVIGDISLTERNLFGNGQYLRLKLAASQTRREAELSFTEPYLLGRRVAGGFDVFFRDDNRKRTSSYKSWLMGGKLRLGLEVARNTGVELRYSLSRNSIYGVGASASEAIKQAVPGYPNATAGTYDTSAIGYGVTYDTRDKKTFPMRGVYIATSQDLAGIGGNVRYLRSTLEARAYYPVTDRIALATRVMGGTISGWGGQDVRLLDMFYRGGETVRGFAPGGIGPRDLLSANKDALGGRHYVATTAELRFPLPFVPEHFDLGAAIFADAGSLWGTNRQSRAVPGVIGTTAHVRASAGIGLTWNSPLGPLRVDYAHVLAKQPFDKTQPLSFGLVPGF